MSKGQQLRSRRTFEQLLDATESLLEEKTFEEIRIEEIVARAGSSIGSFYARFPNKELLRDYLIERYHDDLIAAADDILAPEKWLGVDLAGRAEAFIRGVVEICRRRYGLMRMRSLHYITHPEEMSGVQLEKMRAFVSRVEAFFEPSLPEPAKGTPPPNLSFALRVVDIVIASTILLNLDEGSSYRDVDDDMLVQETTRTFLRYLGA